MKFTFTPNQFASRHLLSDENRGAAKVVEEKKWNTYLNAVDVYKADKERYLDHADKIGRLHEARKLLNKMEVDPANKNPKGFLECWPEWPTPRVVGQFDTIPLGETKHHQDDFYHLGIADAHMINLDAGILGMAHTLKLVDESGIKSIFKKNGASSSSKEWTYVVAEREKSLGKNRPAFAIAWMVVHDFNRRNDERQSYMHARFEIVPSRPQDWQYVLLYPQDNAERHIWREVFLGIPRPQGSLLPPPLQPAPAVRPAVASPAPNKTGDLQKLIHAKEVLKASGADAETLAAITAQITKLAITTPTSSNSGQPRTSADRPRHFV